MNGIIVGIDSANKSKVYRMVMFEKTNGNWQFGKQMVPEIQLVDLMAKKKVRCLNATVANNKIKGTTGDLARFDNKVNNPLVIISELVTSDGVGIGYKVVNNEGVVKNTPSKEVLAYCARTTANGGIPIQNGMYVAETGGQKAHIRCYPGGEYIKEVIERNKSKNAKASVVDTTKNEKALTKIEELFNSKQVEQLKLGKQNGVNIKIYGNNKFSAEQMEVLRKTLEDGSKAELIADPEYSVSAMKILRADMKYGVDISYYANPGYSAEQLSELSSGYLDGVDISKYADVKINPVEMAEIRLRLVNNIFKELQVNKDDSWK